MQHNYFIYILTNKTNKVVYIGVTNDLKRRIYEHRMKLFPGFTRKYNLDKLVYFERYQNIDDAIIREKRLKKWKRSWKNDLINKMNPEWKDLYEEVVNW
ncbi:MAG: GIY-YIG nuclease family protein [Marinilabiliaceae bacterium]|jgi:putative endonuclease|nr:GIY-YIG nuclease family protein [Marinilabiliaceae bacterium]